MTPVRIWRFQELPERAIAILTGLHAQADIGDRVVLRGPPLLAASVSIGPWSGRHSQSEPSVSAWVHRTSARRTLMSYRKELLARRLVKNWDGGMGSEALFRPLAAIDERLGEPD